MAISEPTEAIQKENEPLYLRAESKATEECMTRVSLGTAPIIFLYSFLFQSNDLRTMLSLTPSTPVTKLVHLEIQVCFQGILEETIQA